MSHGEQARNVVWLRGKRHWIFRALLFLLLLGIASWPGAAFLPLGGRQQVQLYGAQAGGSFNEIAKELARLAHVQKSPLTFSLATSNGSPENLKHVAELDGALGLTFAWYPSQLLHADARNVTYRDVRSIGVVDLDVVHMVVPNGGLSTVKSLAERHGLRVYTGLADSGTRLTADKLLRAVGVGSDQIAEWGATSEKMTFTEAADALRRGDLDAAIFVTGQSAPAIRGILTGGGPHSPFKLLRLESDVRQVLVEDHSYREVLLLTGAKNEEVIETVGHPVVLATNARASAAMVRDVAELLSSQKKELDAFIRPPLLIRQRPVIDGEPFTGVSADPKVLVDELHVDLLPHEALNGFLGKTFRVVAMLIVGLAWALFEGFYLLSARRRRAFAKSRSAAPPRNNGPEDQMVDTGKLTAEQAQIVTTSISTAGAIAAKIIERL